MKELQEKVNDNLDELIRCHDWSVENVRDRGEDLIEDMCMSGMGRLKEIGKSLRDMRLHLLNIHWGVRNEIRRRDGKTEGLSLVVENEFHHISDDKLRLTELYLSWIRNNLYEGSDT